METRDPPPNARHDAYEVRQEADRFLICNDAGRIVMTCGDRGSAEHYADLLNRAFQAGYRNALRDRMSR